MMSQSTRHVVLAALVVLLVASAVALPAAGTAPALSDVSPTGETDAVVSAGDVQSNDSSTDGETDGSGTQPGATLSGVVAGEQRTLDGELRTEDYLVRLERADGQEERAAVLDEMAADLESRLAATEANVERHATTDRAHTGEFAYLETAIRADAAFIDRDAGIGLTLTGALSTDLVGTELEHRFDQVRNRTATVEESLANRTEVPFDLGELYDPPAVDLNDTEIDLNLTGFEDPLGNETDVVEQFDGSERDSLETFLAAVDADRNVSDLESLADLAAIAANVSDREGYRAALFELGAGLATSGDGEYDLSTLESGDIDLTTLEGYEGDVGLEDIDLEGLTELFDETTDGTVAVDDADILTVLALSTDLDGTLTGDETADDSSDDGSDDGTDDGTDDPDSDAELAIVDVAPTAQVVAGDDFVVDATVENVGTATAEDDVTLTVDGPGGVDAATVEVESGSSMTVELSWSTTLESIGQYEATVATDDDSVGFAFEVVEDL